MNIAIKCTCHHIPQKAFQKKEAVNMTTSYDFYRMIYGSVPRSYREILLKPGFYLFSMVSFSGHP